jgi:hypothetical protein
MWQACQIRNKRKKCLAGIPKTKTPLGGNMRSWEDSINMDLKSETC